MSGSSSIAWVVKSGDHLLGELVRPVVVAAVGDRGGEPVGLDVRAHRVVGTCFRRVVGGSWPVRVGLCEGVGRIESEIPVHLAGRDVVEPRTSTPLRAASSSVWVPITFVMKNRPGSITARLLCDSAAKWTIELDQLVVEGRSGERRGRICRRGRRRCGPRGRRGSPGCRRR